MRYMGLVLKQIQPSEPSTIINYQVHWKDLICHNVSNQKEKMKDYYEIQMVNTFVWLKDIYNKE